MLLIERGISDRLSPERSARDRNRGSIRLRGSECGASLLEFFFDQFKARRSHAGTTNSRFFLYLLDELNELWNSIHTQQRQEPPIELESFFCIADPRKVE
jgi:hypothetical protein